MKWKAILLILAVIVIFTGGMFAKGKFDSMLQGANIGGDTKESTGRDKIGRDKIGGDQVTDGDKVSGDKAQGDQLKDNQSSGDIVGGNQSKQQSGGIGSLKAESGSNVQIVIQPGDARYENASQPNLSSSSLAEVKSVELNQFKGANPFTQDLVLPDYGRFVRFSNEKIAILDRIYPSIFWLQGDISERKTIFSLSGNQKGIYLQFGLKDLPEQGDNLMYDVSIHVSNDTNIKKVWSGKVIYGSKNQIISLPFDAVNAKSLVIKYTVAQGDNRRALFFTRAEQLYE